MKIEMRDPKKLAPHPRNSKLHSAEQITALGRAIVEFGFHQPILIDETGTILAGHARTLAAIDINLTSVPCIVQAGLSDADKRALVIADNRLHEFGAGWDADILNDELRHLMASGIDISLTGFDLAEQWAPPEEKPDEDDVPEAPDVPVSEPGDVWALGEHRLFCGDSTDPEQAKAIMAGHKPAIMVTDPPYGVNYDASWRNKVVRSNGTLVAVRATGKVLNDDRADWTDVWKGFTGRIAYIWHSSTHHVEVADSMEAAGFDIRAMIVWDKGRMVIGRGAYQWRHELAIYCTRGKKPVAWRGGRAQSDIWEISHIKSMTGHSTQKPVEAMRRPILNHTKTGDSVYDPFMGSGTTIIAAETCARAAVGSELFPAYVDIGVMRWQNFTGKVATHMSGATFEELAAERAAKRAAEGAANG